jgi:hypothetical protein
VCWSCNPYCGGCKPPKAKPVRCPACKAYGFPEQKNCKRCGAPLPEPPPPVPVMCLYIGQMCANPCGRHKKTPEEGLDATCSYHTPLKEAENPA